MQEVAPIFTVRRRGKNTLKYKKIHGGSKLFTIHYSLFTKNSYLCTLSSKQKTSV